MRVVCVPAQRVCLLITVDFLRPKEERDRLLRGTGIPEAVDRDLANIQTEYTDVVLPFIKNHPTLWNPDTHTLELYIQLVAFVMAYRSVNTGQNTPTYLSPSHRPFLSVVSRSHRKRKTMKRRKRGRPPTRQ